MQDDSLWRRRNRTLRGIRSIGRGPDHRARGPGWARTGWRNVHQFDDVSMNLAREAVVANGEAENRSSHQTVCDRHERVLAAGPVVAKAFHSSGQSVSI